MIEHVFVGCALGVEDMPGDLGGKVILIMDNNTQHTYRFPIPDSKSCREVGGRLMGLGDVQLGTAADLSRLNGKGKA